MTNNAPEFSDSMDRPSQLCFFYNAGTGEISFSSEPLDLFFESSLDLRQAPPFLNAFKESDADFLSTEWKSCLQLKENQSRNFSIEKNFLTFYFTIMGPSRSLVAGQPLLTILVVKLLTPRSRPQEKKTPSFLNEKYNEFIELAAHDLDSPLRKLSMLIERISNKFEADPDNDMQGYLLRTRACLADMHRMVEDLALFARLNLPVSKNASCDIENIIISTWKELPGLPGEKKLVIPHSLPVVDGDLSQYRQLFKSLLQNVLKFKKKDMPPETEVISEEMTASQKENYGFPPDKIYFRITVRDNGIGFRQEYAEKIFEPFVRLNGKSEYPGSGIGLALSKKIVENHGGIIYAEGKENFGAKFTLFLPLKP